MPDLYNQGVLTPYPWLTIFPKTIFGVAQQWYVSRTPLTSRLPSLPIQNVTFSMVTYKFRPRTTTLAVAITSTTATSISLTDASILMNGDKLRIGGEVLEVTAAPDIVANTATVRRGAAGTTAATALINAVVTNLGNTRTGGEKFQLALQQIPGLTQQFIQNFQHVVSVSGVMQAVGSALPLPPGVGGPFEKNKMDALQNVMDDIEFSTLYSLPEAISNNGTVQRQSQAGLFNLIKTNAVAPGGNIFGATNAPSNPTAYKPTDFMNDVIAPIRANGGQPSVIHANNKFITGMAEWGLPLQRFTNGVTKFGTNIQYFISPFLGEIPIVENMWLNYVDPTNINGVGAAMVLTEQEVRFRDLEALKYRPYARVGDTGDAGEGDWIDRRAVEVDNEPHHGYVTGITGFAQQT